MISVREPEEIHRAEGGIQGGTFTGRWHFSFGTYHDPENARFGLLRVFNDDTLSPGAIWPLHPHRDIEVVTYCAEGEFMHADQEGRGGVLRKGWVQHTTVGSGMWHSEINNSPVEPLRFIQMWFYPSQAGLRPSVEQKGVERPERTNRLLQIVAPGGAGALPIHSEARVYASYLEEGASVVHRLRSGFGAYVYVVEGGPVFVNGRETRGLGAAKAYAEKELTIRAARPSELLLVEVMLA